MDRPKIRAATAADASAMAAIYNHYVRGSIYTFEEQDLSAEQMSDRLATVTGGQSSFPAHGPARPLPWLVSQDGLAVIGYAYADLWKPRGAYRNSVEVTIYLHADAIGRGIGRPLYQALIDELRMRDIHCAMASIALPNPASIRLHEALGFEKVGHAREIGCKFDRWVDVGYWQLMLQAPAG